MAMNVPILASEMLVGDICKPRFRDSPYNTFTVYKIENGIIYVKRPFIYSLDCTEESRLTSHYEDYSFYQEESSTERQWLLLARVESYKLFNERKINMEDSILTPKEELDLYLDLAEENLNSAKNKLTNLVNNPELKYMFEPPPEIKIEETKNVSKDK